MKNALRVAVVLDAAEVDDPWIRELRVRLGESRKIELLADFALENDQTRLYASWGRRALRQWRAAELPRTGRDNPFHLPTSRTPSDGSYRVAAGVAHMEGSVQAAVASEGADVLLWLLPGQLPDPKDFNVDEIWRFLFPVDTVSASPRWSMWSRAAGGDFVEQRFVGRFRPDRVSDAANDASARWQAVDLLPELLTRPATETNREERVPLATRSDWRTVVRWVARGLKRRVAQRLKRPEEGKWVLGLGVVEDPARRLVEGHPLSLTVAEPSPGAIWADPYLIADDKQTLVFFEEVPAGTDRGHITCGIVEDSRLVATELVLARPYHLAYPYLFRWRGSVFMIPESALSGATEVYRATRFPTEWTLEDRWMEGQMAVDVTLVEHRGMWWMFHTTGRLGRYGFDEVLHVRHASSPLGPWTAHRRNPIQVDPAFSRGAGRPFLHNDRLYRPAQDCSVRYGGAISLLEIERLDEQCVTETRVQTIKPWTPQLLGTHTVSFAGRNVALDGLLNATSRMGTSA